MKREDELNFVSDIADENIIIELYNRTYNNLENLNEKVDKFTLYLAVIILVFFISSNIYIENFSIGIITIKDISVLMKILPVIYFQLLYMIITMSYHKSELYFAVKKLGRKIYQNNYDNPKLYPFQNNFIDRISLPFSFSSFGNQLVLKEGGIGNALMGIFIAIPALIGALSTFVIGIYMIKNIYYLHFNDFLGKLSFFYSIWMVLFIVYTISVGARKNNGEDLR